MGLGFELGACDSSIHQSTTSGCTLFSLITVFFLKVLPPLYHSVFSCFLRLTFAPISLLSLLSIWQTTHQHPTVQQFISLYHAYQIT